MMDGVDIVDSLGLKNKTVATEFAFGLAAQLSV